ncbi:hypothetical protein BGZ98_006484, partial [Dissophora globulifera]
SSLAQRVGAYLQRRAAHPRAVWRPHRHLQQGPQGPGPQRHVCQRRLAQCPIRQL